MQLYTIKYQQFLPIDIEQAWDFFSNPKNLVKITPHWLNFKMRSNLPDQMYAGMIAQYHVHPIAGIPVTWTTEITHMRHHNYFVDEQRLGPYKFWHHQHHFKEVEGDIEMIDIVDFGLPLRVVGRWLYSIYVKGRLEKIFSFRRQALIQYFGEIA